MCLDGDRVSGSVRDFAVVVDRAAGVVVGVTVVEVFGVMDGFLSLLSIFPLSLLPNSLFQGILPRIILETVVVVIVVEIDNSLFVVKNGSIVGSNSGASAEVM